MLLPSRLGHMLNDTMDRMPGGRRHWISEQVLYDTPQRPVCSGERWCHVSGNAAFPKQTSAWMNTGRSRSNVHDRFEIKAVSC